ncbi:hypothetical protein ABK040_004901 [Willaertia magna]
MASYEFSQPLKKVKLDTSEEHEEKEKSKFSKLNQLQLFYILSFLPNESLVNFLCLNKTIFNEIILQVNPSILPIYKNISIMLSVIFNHKLKLLVDKELFNDLNLELNNENFFTILFNHLNKDNFYKTITNNVEFNCNDGKTSFSKDTMIYYEKCDDFLQNEYNCKKNLNYFSIQNENNLKLSFLKNTLHRLRYCFEYLTCHVQALQSYLYKRSQIQWFFWLNDIKLPKKKYYKLLKFFIQFDLRIKLFEKVTFVTVKKCKIDDYCICTAKYKIKNLEFKYKAIRTEKSSDGFNWTLQVKFFNNENNIVNLVENNKKIIVNLTYLNKIKDHLELNDNKFITDEMLTEAILLACPQWNILNSIKKGYNITKISFDNQEVFLPICDSIYIEEEMSPIIQTMQHNSFTILSLPDEILNCICDYLFFIKDGLSFCLVSKDIYYAIYNTNKLFLSNRIINSFIPSIMTEIYNQINKQKLKDEFTYKNTFYHDLSFNYYDTDYPLDTHYFPLFTTCITRIEYFIGYIDSIQRYIYVKQNEWNSFLTKVNDKHVVKQLQDKVFSKVICKYSQINALDDKWIFKTLYNIKDKIQFEQIITFFENDNEVIMNSHMEVLGDDKLPSYSVCFPSDLPVEELQELRQWLELDEQVSIDCLSQCLKYCSPLKYEFIDFCEKNMDD